MLRWTTHELKIVQGQFVPGATFPIRDQGELALDTPSDEIKGPCLLRVVSTVAAHLDAKTSAAELDPATAKFPIYANVPFEIPIVTGRIFIQAAAASFPYPAGSGGGSELIDEVTNLSGAGTTIGNAFEVILAADPARREGTAFQNGHATDVLQVIEGNFANAVAAQAAWDAGGGFEVQPKDPYFPDSKMAVWGKRGGSNDIPVRGHRG